VLSFSEALWKEAEGTDVHVSCLCPGPTESAFHGRAGTDSTRLLKFGQMSSAAVAQAGYDGFQKNRRVVIPGVHNALLARSVAFSPRPMVLSLVRYLQSA
jgi:hypothetical protein